MILTLKFIVGKTLGNLIPRRDRIIYNLAKVEVHGMFLKSCTFILFSYIESWEYTGIDFFYRICWYSVC